MKVVLLVAVTMGVAYGQGGQCEQKFSCLAEKLRANGPSPAEMAQMKQALMAAKEAAGDAVSSCFVDAGCEDPIPAIMEFKECMKREIAPPAVEAVFGCLSQQGVPIPPGAVDKILAMIEQGPEAEPPAELPGLVKLIGGMLMKKGKGGKGNPLKKLKKKFGKLVERAAEEACPDEESADEALQCTQEALQNMARQARGMAQNKFGGGKGNGGGKAALIGAVMACGGPDQCLQQLQQAKKAACKCSKQLNNPETKGALVGAIQQCKEEAGIDAELTEEDEQMIKKKLQKLKKKVCKNGGFGGGRGGGRRRGGGGRRGRGPFGK